MNGIVMKTRIIPATEEHAEIRSDCPAPVAYDMDYLRYSLRILIEDVIAGRQKSWEFPLERFPQVNTVMGEMKALFGETFTWGWTSKEEHNIMFRIERAK